MYAQSAVIVSRPGSSGPTRYDHTYDMYDTDTQHDTRYAQAAVLWRTEHWWNARNKQTNAFFSHRQPFDERSNRQRANKWWCFFQQGRSSWRKPPSARKSHKKQQKAPTRRRRNRRVSLVVPRMTADVGGDGREWREKNFFLTPHVVMDRSG